MSKDFSVEQLESLMKCVSDNGICEFLFENEETKLRIRGGQYNVGQAAVPVNVIAPVPIEVPAQTVAATFITSPIVGTFYSAASPDKEPFARVGQHINEGDTVFIIESMKVMNEVPADKSGTVAEILVENGEGVEYGQPILRLE